MTRIAITVSDEFDARISLEARRRGVFIADIAREALEQSVPGPTPTGPPGFFSVGEGEPLDACERVDEFAGAAIVRRGRPSA